MSANSSVVLWTPDRRRLTAELLSVRKIGSCYRIASRNVGEVWSIPFSSRKYACVSCYRYYSNWAVIVLPIVQLERVQTINNICGVYICKCNKLIKFIFHALLNTVYVLGFGVNRTLITRLRLVINCNYMSLVSAFGLAYRPVILRLPPQPRP